MNNKFNPLRNCFTFKQKDKFKKAKAFSLGETLIAIGVLGVICAVLIPLVIALVHDKVRASHVDLFKKKFSKAMEMMALQGEVGPYYKDTQEFVEYLGGHLKINSVCRVGNEPSSLPPIEHCFGENYPGITLSDGTLLELSEIQTGDSFAMSKNSTNDWTTPNIGILTVDGNHIILSYNLQCAALVAGVYSGDVPSKCVAGVMDVDGNKSPNKLGKDVSIFASANGLGGRCFVSYDGLCLSAPKRVAQAVTYEECMSKIGTLGMNESQCVGSDYNSNYFVPMAEECGGWGSIASPQDVKKMIDYMYSDDIPANGSKTDIEYVAYAELFGLPTPSSAGVYIANWTIDCPPDVTGKCELNAQKLTREAVSSVKINTANSSMMDVYFFCKK